MRGVVVVDKPQGITSFDVVARCRRIFSEKRIGHTGTLDPMATGVLVVCLGEATKLVPMLTDCDKRYDAEAILGVETDSEDATGKEVSRTPATHLDRTAVEAALATLVGALEQKPPMHSAVRVDGERLYEKARRGEVIERAARTVHVHQLTLTSFAIEGDVARVKFSVHCGKGTFVRTLASELGRKLGVGGHLSALRRTAVGEFKLSEAIALSELAPETPLVGLAEALGTLPKLAISAADVRAVRDGKLSVISQLKTDARGRIRLLGPASELLAVGVVDDGKIVLERVFNDIDIDPRLGPNTATKKSPETKDL